MENRKSYFVSIVAVTFLLVASSRNGVIDPVDAFHTKSFLVGQQTRLQPGSFLRYRGQQQESNIVGTVFSERRKGSFATKGMGYNAYLQKKPEQRRRRTTLGRLLWKWRQFRKWMHRLIHRTTVYVLELDHNKYYVGSTTNPKRRFREHFDNRRGGSRWTRLHRPVRVEAQIRRVPHRFLVGVEAQVTAEYMLKYGVNNVRGAYFTNPRNYTLDDISILTGFLGHYGNLDFKLLEKKLEKTLPHPSPAGIRRSYYRHPLNLPLVSNNLLENRMAALRKSKQQRQRTTNRRSGHNTNQRTNNNKRNDVCYNCGQFGHWANECPNRSRKSYNSDEQFLRSVLNSDSNGNNIDEAAR